MLREGRNILEPILLIILQNSSERNYAQISTSQHIFERERERTNECKIAYNKQRKSTWTHIIQ